MDYELDKNEKEIAKDFDNGKFTSVKKLKSEKTKYEKYAKATL